MSSVGLVVHLRRPEAGSLAAELAGWLQAAGHTVRVPEAEAAIEGLAPVAVEDSSFVEGLDLVVTLGGDGSILRAVRFVGATGVPVLGVDLGLLGYLTEVPPAGAREAVARVLAGDHRIEERMLIEVRVDAVGAHEPMVSLALNEAVVERTAGTNTVRLAVHLDDELFTTYAADGLIVATPTGSTAYAFSARGPMIDPTHRAMLLTPVSPHMLFDRSLVLVPSTRLRLTVDGHRPASLSVDGCRVRTLGDGDRVECTASPDSVRLVTFGSRRFHRVLKAKFGLNDR